MDNLATVDDVAGWFEEPLTEGMVRLAGTALLSASDSARDVGNPSWNSVNVPGPVRRIVAAATARYLRNPDGFIQSRAADETLGWQETDAPGEVTFSKDELARLARFGQHTSGFGSVQIVAWGVGPARRELTPVWPVGSPMYWPGWEEEHVRNPL